MPSIAQDDALVLPYRRILADGFSNDRPFGAPVYDTGSIAAER